jgi:3-deoxy-D-manno-octulosonic-acid transferase
VYDTFSRLCAVSEVNKERLSPLVTNTNDIVVCGDTRYDRVYARAIDTARIQNLIDSGLFKREKCFIAGSSWPVDEKFLLPTIRDALERHDDFTAIIAPHEISDQHLDDLEHYFQSADIPIVRHSQFETTDAMRVLLIDGFGLLANLYALGAIAYVGGGFGVGVHSVLEPAAHGTVVSYGPHHLNSPEAKEMTTTGIGVPINGESEFRAFLFQMLQKPQELARRGKETKEYVMRNIGASGRTTDVLEQFLHHS